MARKTAPVNTAMEILEIQENHGEVKEYYTPPALVTIHERFVKAMEEGTEVLIENSELSSAHSVVVKIEYVGGRWCLGYQTIQFYSETVKVPYTIHFTDVYGINESERRKSSRQVKIIFKGENPFD